MQKYTEIVLGQSGQTLLPAVGVSVAILNYPAGTPATIYSDNGVTQTANPLTTDVNGRYSFYAANGRYSIQVTVGGVIQQTIIDFPLQDDPANPQTSNITSGTIANVAISNSSLTNTTAVTQGPLDNSTLVSTDAFVANQIIRSKSTAPVTITGGTYNLNVTGTGLTAVVTVTSGVITAISSIATGGTGYAVGDVVVLIGGNVDAIVRVTNVSAGVVQAGGLSILYGGTGYTTGATLPTAKAGINGGNIITLTGVLTSNATIIFVRGTPLTASSRVIINNNTTGNFTVSVFMSNGSGGTTGTGVVVPQGANNSTAMILQTDGQTDVWSSVSATTSLTLTGALIPNQTIGTIGTTTNNNANAGSIGEYITASTLTTSLISGSTINATSVSLTAGDWDVTGILQTNPAGGTTTVNIVSGINTVSATFGTAAPSINNYNLIAGLSVPGGAPINVDAPLTRVSIAATTTVYLVAQVGFSAGTMTVSGFIRARRVR